MKELLFLIPLLACIQARSWIFREGSDDVYLILRGEVSWIFAREMCLAQGADLLTIKDEAEREWIYKQFPVHPRDKAATRDHFVLLGLNDVENNGNWYWVDETPLKEGLIEWNIKYDDIVQNCGALNTKTRELFNINCDFRILPDVTTHFVCKAHYQDLVNRRMSNPMHQAVFSLSRKRRHLRLCERGWHYYNDGCWKLVEVKLHWFAAQIHCWNKEGGAALAALNNEHEADYLLELQQKVYNGFSSGVWVNAFDSAEEGKWTTHDGKSVYIRWVGGQLPTDPKHRRNCLIALPDGNHKDVTCSRRSQFYCRKRAGLFYKQAEVIRPPGETPNFLVRIPPEFIEYNEDNED